MNTDNGIGITQLATLVDDFLGTALHFRITPLYRGKIQILMAHTRGHRGRRSTTQADQHGRTAQHNDLRTRRNAPLLDVLGTHIPHPAGEHDGLMVPPHLLTIGSDNLLFVTAEITANIGTAEFIIEGGRADGCFQHDIQRGYDPIRFAIIDFPGLRHIWQLEIGDGKPA